MTGTANRSMQFILQEAGIDAQPMQAAFNALVAHAKQHIGECG
jgi:hypothetical protein